MWCTSGCAPVAIDDRQTGVSDGNVDVARRYVPVLGEEASAGRSSAASNIDGVRPSMTTRTTLGPQSRGERAQPCVAVGGAAGAAARRAAGTASASR